MSTKATLLTSLLGISLFTALTACGSDPSNARVSNGPSPTPTHTSDVVRLTVSPTISPAELRDLQTVAEQRGISLQAAIDRYAWNDDFAAVAASISGSFPDVYAGAEIVDANNAWVAFSGTVPQRAREMIATFTETFPAVSVELRGGATVTEQELQKAVPAVHYVVYNRPEVHDATTSHDPDTGLIRTLLVLEDGVPESFIDELQALAEQSAVDAVGPDILDKVGILLVVSDHPVIGVSFDGRIDGPVLVSPPPWDHAAGMAAIVGGVLVFDPAENCLRLAHSDVQYPVVWPEGASWQSDPPAVRIQGQVIEPGMSVSGGGGYLYHEHIGRLAGTEVADAADACAGPTGEIAFFNLGSEVDVVSE